ncbi:MAG: DUF1295 domain-containing protein [Draconibacterium sp.]|nr:DUF1295 domain-containing protein [Draconibacterium sp.]
MAVSSNTKEGSFIKYIIYPIFIFILVLFICELINPVLETPYSILPEFLTQNIFHSIILKISGVLIIITSLIFLIFTLSNFNKSLRFGIDSENMGKLITTGIFSISRNPFFGSINLYFIGIALIYLSAFFTTFAVLNIVSIHYFILKEEKFLLKNYGEKYEKYTKDVRRYF